MSSVNIISMPTGPLGTNTYIVFHEGSSDAVVVDPANSSKVLKKLSENGLHCTDILLTHGHFDHIMGVAELKAQENARVHIHALDAPSLQGGSGSLSSMMGIMVKRCEADDLLEDGAHFTAAGFDFLCIHTPGHSVGSCCYVMESEHVIFSGDTLFRLSVGRTDLSGGDAEALYDSILKKLFPLPGDYRVLPGHERETTLEFERQHNPFMRNGGRDW